MQVLGIMASPRRGSNTEMLLDRVLAGAAASGAKVETVVAVDLDISPCLEIYACEAAGECAIADDMQAIYHQIEAADVVVLASPIFFYGLTAQAKAIVDRCQAMWFRTHRLGRPVGHGRRRRGALVCVGATRGRRLFDGATLTARYFFDAIGADYTADLLVRGIDEKGAIASRPDVLGQAFELGRRLAAEAE